ncbi:hypothetical protein ES332_A10G257400v1 [Gossypium tomentosum]|uniref:Zinc knuckle CX2CX4HX4C domain-containing protein n=1 Tax=Gossypium tomentosum TaxID=34277 RepID=A0A5D2NUX4_GOSTO|nr:hypothetical protein ES332_A10G257400v1 [Gossypium tomentosum]
MFLLVCFLRFWRCNWGIFLGNFLEYDGSNLGKENRNFMRIIVQIDVRRHLKRKKHIMFCGRRSFVRFKHERLSLFCFYYGRLGHSDSFCEANMTLGVEVAEMGWDLSLRAQSQKALAMNSIWLRKEGEGELGGICENNRRLGNSQWKMENKMRYKKNVDSVLGKRMENALVDQAHTTMDHDLEDAVIIGEEGKKRSRRKIDDLTGKDEISNVIPRNRRMVELNHLLSAAAKRQVDRAQ